MKRTIKFRGLRIDGKGWVYGVPYFIAGEPICFIIDNCQSGSLTQEDSIFQGKEVEYKSVGQFTGLKDVNGTDIYEGDSLLGRFQYDRDNFILDVVYDKYSFVASRGNWNVDWNNECITVEITGNIHEK